MNKLIWNRRKDLLEKVQEEEQTRPLKGYVQPHGATQQIAMQKVQPLGAGLSTVQQCFKVQLKQPVTQDPASATIWTYNVPNLLPGQKRVMLQMIGGQLIILNIPSTDFPQQMYLFCEQLNGYVDENGDPTHAIAILRIQQLVPCVIANTVTYTLIYKIVDSLTWDLGGGRVLTISFGDINGKYIPPLPQTVSTQFKIVHVAY